ncbi:MAG: HdeA family protein [Beijerinckiaceae bacterium]|nr:HdeA family protein [Beijerinckiaceae bacterium]
MLLCWRRLAVLAGVMAGLCSAGNVRAEPIDLMRATCADFVAMNGNDRSQISLWLAGYFAGGAQRPMLDIEKIAAAPEALAELCAKAPQAPLIGAETRAVFIPTPAP